MKKISEWIEGFFCRIPSDKYAHLLVCIIGTFVIGHGIYMFSDYDLPSCAAMGAVAMFVLGAIKESLDEFTGGEISYSDLATDFLGCLIGLTMTAL